MNGRHGSGGSWADNVVALSTTESKSQYAFDTGVRVEISWRTIWVPRSELL